MCLYYRCFIEDIYYLDQMPESKPTTSVLFNEIRLGSSEAFNKLFSLYYDRLVSFAQQYTRQPESAEELVSELFVKIWIKRETLAMITNPQAYLFISVKNACLNMIRDNRKHFLLFPVPHQDEVIQVAASYNGTVLEERELVRILDSAVAALPEQRRLIFKLLKQDGLKSKDVAIILGISVRTVENQLYKAVKTLASELSKYLGYDPQKRISKKQALSNLPLLLFL